MLENVGDNPAEEKNPQKNQVTPADSKAPINGGKQINNEEQHGSEQPQTILIDTEITSDQEIMEVTGEKHKNNLHYVGHHQTRGKQ